MQQPILDLTRAHEREEEKEEAEEEAEEEQKKRKKKQADLDAIYDGLDVVSLSAQFGLPYFFCPGSNAAAHGPYGLRPNPHCLQTKIQAFGHSERGLQQNSACLNCRVSALAACTGVKNDLELQDVYMHPDCWV